MIRGLAALSWRLPLELCIWLVPAEGEGKDCYLLRVTRDSDQAVPLVYREAPGRHADVVCEEVAGRGQARFFLLPVVVAVVVFIVLAGIVLVLVVIIIARRHVAA